MKNFLKLNKVKMAILILVGLLGVGANVSDIAVGFFFWPRNIITNLTVGGNSFEQFDRAFLIPPPLIVSLIILSLVAYWYLLACMIAGLLSRLKRAPARPAIH